MSLARLSSWCHMAGVCDSCSFSWLKNTARPHSRQHMQTPISLPLAQWLVVLFHALHCKHLGYALNDSCRTRCHSDALGDGPLNAKIGCHNCHSIGMLFMIRVCASSSCPVYKPRLCMHAEFHYAS